MAKKTRADMRKIRHLRVRKKVYGTSERPRLAIFRSNRYIYAQIIDDDRGLTLVSASSLEKGFREKYSDKKSLKNKDIAAEIGKLIAERAKEKGITKVVFDRGGFKYHGKIKALADAAREAGLEF